MKCGIKYDKDIQTDNLLLHMYNGVYFPENHYYNSDALPIEWLEIFETKEKLLEIEEKFQMQNLYQPSSERNQLDYAK